jgi:hypothetical protein
MVSDSPVGTIVRASALPYWLVNRKLRLAVPTPLSHPVPNHSAHDMQSKKMIGFLFMVASDHPTAPTV